MARQIGWALALSVLVGVPAAQAGTDRGSLQTDQQRPGNQQRQEKKTDKPQEHRGPWLWWKDDRAKAELKLAADQAAEIERIFQAYLAKAKPLREEVNQLQASLDQTMKANSAEVPVVSQLVEKVENKRAELNKLRTVMLYSMRRVLTPEQNTKFTAMADRWEAARKKDGTSGGHRR